LRAYASPPPQPRRHLRSPHKRCACRHECSCSCATPHTPPPAPRCPRIAATTASTAPAVPARLLFSASLMTRLFSALHAIPLTPVLSLCERIAATADSTSATALIASLLTLPEKPEVRAASSGLPRHHGLVKVESSPEPACPSNLAAQREHPGHATLPEGSQLRAALGTGRVVGFGWPLFNDPPSRPG
jgi:hypothetical protein